MTVRFLSLAVLGLAGLAALAGAEDARPPALRGLDPVELCEGRETPGDAARDAVHGAYRYVFASDGNRQRFLSEPERWGIQWQGACGRMGPASGKGDPARWLVHDGRIWIFASEDCRSTFARDPAAFLEPDEDVPSGSDADRAEGRRLLERAVEALGGAERLDGMATLRLAYEQPGGSPGLTTSTEIAWRFPSHFRRHREHGGRWPETVVVTPDDAFLRTGEGVETLHPAARRELERIALRNPLVLLRGRAQPGFVAVAAGRAAVAETDAVAVEIGYRGLLATMAVARESGLPVGLAYRGRTRTGAFGRIDERLGDWCEVEGLKLPFRRDLFHAGAEMVPGGVKVTAASVNPALPDALFTR